MISKECLSVSLFSEWIASMVEVHGSLGYKITIVTMGALAREAPDEAMSDRYRYCHCCRHHYRHCCRGSLRTVGACYGRY